MTGDTSKGSELSKQTNFVEPDLAYTAVIDVHRDLTCAQSAELNACLVFILVNHIGDLNVLNEALSLARRTVERAGTS